MPMYRSTGARFNTDELDPCLAAEVRIKNDLLHIRQSRCLFCIVLTLTILLLVMAFMMIQYFGLFSFFRDTSENSPRLQVSDSSDTVNYSLNENFSSFTIPSEAVIPMKYKNSIKEDNKKNALVVSEEYLFNIIKNKAPENTFIITQTPATTKITTTKTVVSLSNFETTKAMPNAVLIPNNHENKIYFSALSAFSPLSEEVVISEGKSDCNQYRKLGYTVSGIYNLLLPGIGNFSVYCLMNDDHAWTILQRRSGPKLHFWNSSFIEYMNGFGDLKGDHWLGLEKVHSHFYQNNYKLELRIVLIGDFCPSNSRKCSGLGDDGFWWGDWEFSMAGKSDFYRLKHIKFIKGNLSDENSVDYFREFNEGQPFTTVDSDNDRRLNVNSAKYRQKGGWWHKDHTFVSLNGAYGTNNGTHGQSWYYFNKLKSYNIKPQYSLMLFRIKE